MAYRNHYEIKKTSRNSCRLNKKKPTIGHFTPVQVLINFLHDFSKYFMENSDEKFSEKMIFKIPLRIDDIPSILGYF